MRSRMRESASTDLRKPQGSNPLGPPGPELSFILRFLSGGSSQHESRGEGNQRSNPNFSSSKSGSAAFSTSSSSSLMSSVRSQLKSSSTKRFPAGETPRGSAIFLTVTDFGGQLDADMTRQNGHDLRPRATEGGGSWPKE